MCWPGLCCWSQACLRYPSCSAWKWPTWREPNEMVCQKRCEICVRYTFENITSQSSNLVLYTKLKHIIWNDWLHPVIPGAVFGFCCIKFLICCACQWSAGSPHATKLRERTTPHVSQQCCMGMPHGWVTYCFLKCYPLVGADSLHECQGSATLPPNTPGTIVPFSPKATATSPWAWTHHWDVILTAWATISTSEFMKLKYIGGLV